jgi:Leucine-rich repeat (LRR) protein
LRAFESVPGSKKLDSIALAYNHLEVLSGLERAPNLTVLDLHNNKLTELPTTVLELKQLKTLKISNNDLSDINPRISLMPNLVRINIEGNPLKSIKSTMRNAGAEQLKKYLKMRLDEGEVQQEESKQAVIKQSKDYDPWDILLREFLQNNVLDLRNKGLTEISPKLWRFDSIVSIDLSQNQISAIPEDIIYLKNLRNLRVQNAFLKSLPMSLLQLSTL